MSRDLTSYVGCILRIHVHCWRAYVHIYVAFSALAVSTNCLEILIGPVLSCLVVKLARLAPFNKCEYVEKSNVIHSLSTGT